MVRERAHCNAVVEYMYKKCTTLSARIAEQLSNYKWSGAMTLAISRVMLTSLTLLTDRSVLTGSRGSRQDEHKAIRLHCYKIIPINGMLGRRTDRYESYWVPAQREAARRSHIRSGLRRRRTTNLNSECEEERKPEKDQGGCFVSSNIRVGPAVSWSRTFPNSGRHHIGSENRVRSKW
jgi:hypothetical protein